MIPIEELLEAGVHFGHRVNKWNPKMAPYIFGERNGVHIIDLIQTAGYLDSTYTFLQTYSTPRTQGNTGKQNTQGGTGRTRISGPNSILKSGGSENGNSASFNNFSKKGAEETQTPLGKKVLIVGTRKQVAGVVKKEAENCNANYVNYRWLGGLLTNWATIRLCVAKLNKLDFISTQNNALDAQGAYEQAPAGILENPVEGGNSQDYRVGAGWAASQRQASLNSVFSGGKEQTKKERAILKKQYEKLKKFFGGIQYMTELPEIVILVGQDCEMNAVRECQTLSETVITGAGDPRPLFDNRVGAGLSKNSKTGLGVNPKSESRTPMNSVRRLNLRTITLLDTNCDPSLADLFIPANDDSTKSVELILAKLGEAIRTNLKN